MAKIVPEPVPYLPPVWDNADAAAFQALAQGKATEAQQQRALNWLLYGASDVYGLEYRTDPRAHAFVSGRRFVGLQVIKLLKLNLTKMGIKTKVETNVDPFKHENPPTKQE